jgi:hypothetical protein
MRIEFLIVADAVQVADGKLFVLGGAWSTFKAPMFPIQMPVGIALSILIEGNEAGTGTIYPMSVTVSDEGGVPIIPPLQAQFQVGKTEGMPSGMVQRMPFALNVPLPIQREGKYIVTATAGPSARAQTQFHAIFVGQKISLTPPTASPQRGT